MASKVISLIVALYGCIGFVIVTLTKGEDILALISVGLLFGLLPLYFARGIWLQNKSLLIMTALYFLMQSIKYVGSDILLFNTYPISIAFPITDFSNGDGYLVDFFPIFMALLLIGLYRTVHVNEKVKL